VVADGTNSSDLGEFRPGLKAVEELGIYSPLLEAGVSKEESREIARFLGLPVAEKPPSSCLATRVPHQERLTRDRLQRIDAAEKLIRKVAGIKKVLRVRDHGDMARLEVTADEQKLILEQRVC